jgi:hypothetical protein
VSVNGKSYWMLRRERLTAAGICIDCANKPKKETARRCNDCSNRLVSFNRVNKTSKTKRPRVEYLNESMAEESGAMTFTAIADDMGISRSRVMQIYFRALDKMLRECKRRGIDAADVLGGRFSMIATAERWA